MVSSAIPAHSLLLTMLFKHTGLANVLLPEACLTVIVYVEKPNVLASFVQLTSNSLLCPRILHRSMLTSQAHRQLSCDPKPEADIIVAACKSVHLAIPQRRDVDDRDGLKCVHANGGGPILSTVFLPYSSSVFSTISPLKEPCRIGCSTSLHRLAGLITLQQKSIDRQSFTVYPVRVQYTAQEHPTGTNCQLSVAELQAGHLTGPAWRGNLIQYLGCPTSACR